MRNLNALDKNPLYISKVRNEKNLTTYRTCLALIECNYLLVIIVIMQAVSNYCTCHDHCLSSS